MEETLDGDAYVGWFSYLSPSSGYAPLVLVSAAASVGVFALGYVVARIGNVAYLSEPLPYAGAFGIFWTFVWLGWADEVYVGVWNDARAAFAVDDETYRDVVRPRLERILDARRILAYWTVLAIPYFVIAGALYLPGLPLHDPVREVLLRAGFSPHLHGNRVIRVIVVYLFGAVSVLVFVTVINGFANHLLLVGEVSELPFRDVHTAASELEPIAGFTMASATAWFAGVSVIVLLMEAGLGSDIGLTVIAILVLAGVVFFLAPQVVLHSALTDAKREVLVGIRKEYEEMQMSIRRGTEPLEDLPLRLDVTDRRLESAKSIRTWAYDVSSAGTLVASSVIPWLTLVEKMGELPLLG